MTSRLSSLILAAGLGTRMKSAKAKVLHELLGYPLVRYPTDLALQLGAAPVVLVVGHQAKEVETKVRSIYPESPLAFAIQHEQRGTGHAVMEGMKAIPDFSGRILILYGDVPLLRLSTLKRLVELQVDATNSKSSPIALMTTLLQDPKGYGRIVRNDAGELTKIVEEKDATPTERNIREGNAGIYCVDSTWLRESLSKLTNNNAQKEYYLTDLIHISTQQGRRVQTLCAEDSSEVLGANSKKDLSFLGSILRQRIAENWMIEGVSIDDPQSVTIEPDVKIGRDTVLKPNVHLRGKTVVGEGCTIDVGCVLESATIHDRVTIRPYTVIENAKVMSKAVVGPYSRLRPDSIVGEEAHVGNFVELKKTTLGKRSKANHLAYIGDSIVGEDSNIGAGTITCNYDGYGKYKTEIGNGVFVGSNSTLVAPLRLGDGAYLAAGSTITDTVDANDLAFGRARQENKKGRAQELRAKAKETAMRSKGKK